MTSRVSLRRPSAVFALSTLTVVAACWLVLRSAAFAAHPDVLAWGVTFDLAITIPLLYWLFVVRPGHAGAITLVPLFIGCTLLAAALLPRAQQQFLGDLRILAIPLELVLAAVVVRRVSRREGRVAEAIASELEMFHYALFCWRKTPPPVEGRAITFHQRSGWGSIVACAIVLIASEGIAMHLFLSRWSVNAAWGWTILDVWGALWFLGDYHALRLRRSFLDGDALHIRHGVRWSVDIARANIASIDEVRDEREWKRRDVLRLAMLDEPRWLITLREPVVAVGLMGLRKTIRAVALLPDDESVIGELTRSARL